MTDLEIARITKLSHIKDIANKLNLSEDDVEYYGKYKAKIDNKLGNKNGKLILVTSINPTPYGEGKTTVSIGIHDALCKLGLNSLAVLREPSLGPVFGIKGGATGGGYAQIMPSVDINLHFTGDFHAITSSNNLLCACLDNHIFQGNELNIDPKTILFNRCIDMNDRALRNIKLDNREEHFNITAASEIMAIFCLATSLIDLKDRLGNILVGYTYDKEPIFARDLGCTDAMTILLKDSIKPNLVQTIENNPVIIHGGPFANIAHGCNSIIATKLALSLADYVITEAGFGADLGAEKFFDIKCRNNIKPDCVVINFTIKALKYNGYCPKEEINKPNLAYIEKGIINLKTHTLNVKKYTNNIVICLNKFDSDTDEEIEYVKNYVNSLGIVFEICDSFKYGGEGSIDLAKAIVKTCEKQNDFKFLYNLDDTIQNKITKICKEIYKANSVEFTENAIHIINSINKLGCSKYPICIAKTQYSLSNNPELLGYPTPYSITVDRLKVQTAGTRLPV
jgi:formate--tetrahydrofolate ligase